MSIVNLCLFVVFVVSFLVGDVVVGQSVGNTPVASVPISANGTTFNVTTASRTDSNGFYPPGTSGAFSQTFVLNGIQSAVIKVVRGTAIFFQLVNVNAAHSFYITNSSIGEGAGSLIGPLSTATNSGNALIPFVVDPNGAGSNTIYYNCGNPAHAFMGAAIFVVSAAPAAVVGDPMFIGLRGQRFQVHGYDNAVYNIVSDDNVQVNSRFVFIDQSRECPIIPSSGRQATACWSHAGSYLGAVGIKTVIRGDIIRIRIESGNANKGFAAITINDVHITNMTNNSINNDIISLLQIKQISSHELSIIIDSFFISFQNIDTFLNIHEFSIINNNKILHSHGLLGQTWSNKVYNNKLKYIAGEVDDYLINNNNDDNDELFGDNFIYNQFQKN